jgi:uncharacterized surface protein with fasciclin (FAS1) repeats
MKHVKLFETFMESMGSPMDSPKSVVDIAAGSPDHKTLVAAVTAADLIKTLSEEGPFTIFAPSDDAFAKLPMGTVKDLLKPENKEKLTSILTNHVVDGNVMSGDLRNGQMIPTLGGGKLRVSIRNGEVTIDGSKVINPDLAGTNGVIHVVDNVILPK